MKKLILISSLFTLTSSLAASPLCNAEVCPQNQNALIWENDRFGAYLYGPGNHHCWSGVDVFNKSIPGSAAIAWSKDPDLTDFFKHPNFHDNRGEGMDNYTMGAGRGVGAVALWADGEWKTYGSWEKFEIIHTGDDYVEFKLVYPSFSALGKMTYHITLKKGDDFFRNDVSFEYPNRFRADWRVGPGLDLEPKRGHKGDLAEEPGMVSVYEDTKDVDGENKAFGPEGSSMSAIFVRVGSDVEKLTDMQQCRVLGFKQANFTYYAGCSWSLAKLDVSASPAKWHEHVRTVRLQISKP